MARVAASSGRVRDARSAGSLTRIAATGWAGAAHLLDHVYAERQHREDHVVLVPRLPRPPAPRVPRPPRPRRTEGEQLRRDPDPRRRAPLRRHGRGVRVRSESDPSQIRVRYRPLVRRKAPLTGGSAARVRPHTLNVRAESTAEITAEITSAGRVCYAAMRGTGSRLSCAPRRRRAGDGRLAAYSSLFAD